MLLMVFGFHLLQLKKHWIHPKSSSGLAHHRMTFRQIMFMSKWRIRSNLCKFKCKMEIRRAMGSFWLLWHHCDLLSHSLWFWFHFNCRWFACPLHQSVIKAAISQPMKNLLYLALLNTTGQTCSDCGFCCANPLCYHLNLKNVVSEVFRQNQFIQKCKNCVCANGGTKTFICHCSVIGWVL